MPPQRLCWVTAIQGVWPCKHGQCLLRTTLAKSASIIRFTRETRLCVHDWLRSSLSFPYEQEWKQGEWSCQSSSRVQSRFYCRKKARNRSRILQSACITRNKSCTAPHLGSRRKLPRRIRWSRSWLHLAYHALCKHKDPLTLLHARWWEKRWLAETKGQRYAQKHPQEANVSLEDA